jgi:inner membrane protein involved in colicin E2 resistance
VRESGGWLELVVPSVLAHEVVAVDRVAPGEDVVLRVAYRSRGLGEWAYAFVGEGVAQVRDFALTMTTDFDGFDFPAGTISPTEKARSDKGWTLKWAFESLAAGKRIGIDPPNRLNPGPLSARITFFAPVSLLFFLTVMVILGVLSGHSLHPMNYFFLAAAFFAFHLLLAYLVDHMEVNAAFALSAAVSVFLVVSYLRIVAGMRVALVQAGLAQLVFLVLFSYAFFFEGYTGLTVTVGSVLTLFVLMQLTARVDWAAVFAKR